MSTAEDRRQNVTVFLCWLTYTAAYFGRYSYHSNITSVIATYGVSHAQAGLVATCFFFAYGAGQVIHGVLCHRYPKQWIVPLALWASAAINAAVFCGVPFGALKYLWLGNGLLQSILWPSLMLVMGQDLDQAHMKRAIVWMGTCTLGTFAAYGLNSVFAFWGNFRLSFVFSAALMAAVGLLWLTLFRPAKTQMSVKTEKKADVKRGRVSAAVLFLIAVLCIFAVTNNFVKDGALTWVPSILKETYRLSDGGSLALTTLINVVSIFGALTAVFLNRFIKNHITLTASLFAAAAVLIGLILCVMRVSVWPVVVLFGPVVLLMHTINNAVTTVAPLMLRDKINPGRISGIINGCCYLGSTVSSYVLGLFADRYGWIYVFLLFTVLCALTSAFGFAMRLLYKEK